MRDKLLWFSLGAIAAGVVFAFAAWRLAPVQQPPMTVTSQDSGELARQLAQIDRRLAAIESRGTTPTAPTGHQDVPAAPRPSAPTPAQLRAAETGTDIVNRAISVGLWTRRDAADMRAASTGMDDESRSEFMRQLAVAINDDRLKVEPGADLE